MAHTAKDLPAFLGQDSRALRHSFREIADEERHRLDEAYDCMSRSQASPYSTFAGDKFRRFNRYSNVVPFDGNRVILRHQREDNAYINASRVYLPLSATGTDEERFIATQGPLRSTVSHFWDMCMQECAHKVVIVMLTPVVEDGRERCHKYWTDGSFSVPPVEGTECLNFQFQDQVASGSGQFVRTRWNVAGKQVVHFYYDRWKDFATPSSFEQILELCKWVESEKGADPVVVHCSAGVGRTGTFITIAFMLQFCKQMHKLEHSLENSLEKDGQQPVMNWGDPIRRTVRKLRTQRMMMVQRPEQFEYVYELIRRCW